MTDDRKSGFLSRLFGAPAVETARRAPSLTPHTPPKPWQRGLGPLQFQNDDAPTLIPVPAPKAGAAPATPVQKQAPPRPAMADATLIPVPVSKPAAPVMTGPAPASDATLIPLTRPTVKAAKGSLVLAGLALPRPEALAPPATGWVLRLDAQGRLVDKAVDASVTLSASSGDRRVRCRQTGTTPPQSAPVLTLPSSSGQEALIALLWLPGDAASRLSLPLPDNGAVLFGRAGEEDALNGIDKIAFPGGHCGQLMMEDGRTAVGLDMTLSRQHAMVWQAHGQLHVKMAKARTPISKLDSKRRPVTQLNPHDKGQLSLAPGEYIVVGGLIIGYHHG